jgi:phosphate transport system ATP-binding protein
MRQALVPHARPLLLVENLRLSFFQRSIIEDLSFFVEERSVTSILGKSGVGKTSLLRTLNRLIEEVDGFRVSGKIIFDGENIFSLNPYELRRQVGMVFQQPVIYPISILKNVLFGVHHLRLAPRKNYGFLAEKYLREAFLWNEVKDRLKEPAPMLSIGQQQRLAIARTLAVEPKLILLDEPTSALDQEAMEKLETLIGELGRTRTVILVTHQERQALKLSQNVLYLKSGVGGAERGFFGKTAQFKILSQASC